MNQFKPSEFCWNELATPNAHAAKDFYGKLLGWTFIDKTDGDMTYTMIQNKDQTFGGMWQIPTDQQNHIPPHWLGYILVDNLEETLQNAEQLGATVTMPITPVGDMGRFIIIQDPTGAHIAFWQSMN
jgi:predicted enzyme related to lactoylglutathione lyase